MTVDRNAIMDRARAHYAKHPTHDLMCQLIALVTAVEAQRDAALESAAEEKRIASVWASRCKIAEERAVAAEGERRAFSARIDELEGLMQTPKRAAPTVPPTPPRELVCMVCSRPVALHEGMTPCPIATGETRRGWVATDSPRQPGSYETTAIDRIRSEAASRSRICPITGADVPDVAPIT